MTEEQLTYYSEHPRWGYRKLVGFYQTKFWADVRKYVQDRQDTEKLREGLRFDLSDDRTPADVEREQKRAGRGGLQEWADDAHEIAGRGVFESLKAYELSQFERADR